jgi:molybdopterin-containing oxidoreductase family membrane subunit
MADMGQPQRALNIMLHPTPNSVMFWDMLVLMGYIGLNGIIGWMTISSEKSGLEIPRWVKPLVFLSIPWAVGIHTVTAFLLSGLPGRHLWLTAIMAPRFLASAFASGPAVLLILLYIVKRIGRVEIESEATQTLGRVMLYGMITNIFFYLLEIFTAFYSGIPSHKESLTYLFFGLEGHGKLVPFVWASAFIGIATVLTLLSPKVRQNETVLVTGAALIFVSTYIDKGMALVIGGFVPSGLETITEYTISNTEMFISMGIWAIGLLVVTLLYKMTINIRRERGIH